MAEYVSRIQYKEMLEKTLYTAFSAIVDYHTPCGFTIRSSKNISDIEKQTPQLFSERFFLLMDIIYPHTDILRAYIAEKYRDKLVLYDWLFKLYTDEALFID